ncbi:MAG: UDP-N-acetylmuramoyl-L-alanine--D-glutamate ligase, partial [Limnohabitans sp.]|nr:UDP-N-acetylmuramoyl-L-alanine--D-glutamate ligase [Limnohabitans sp.]
MQQLHNQSVLILGLGDSGLAMARWCARHGAHVRVVDTRAEPPHLATLHNELPNVTFVHGGFEASLIEGQDVRAVFKSPGLTPESVAPVWHAAVAAGLWVGTELTLFAHALHALQTSMVYHPKVVAITGTNGKTTVTSLTGRLLERAGLRVAVAGNIGPTLLDTLAQALDAAELAQAEADRVAEQEAATHAAEHEAAARAAAEAKVQTKAETETIEPSVELDVSTDETSTQTPEELADDVATDAE